MSHLSPAEAGGAVRPGTSGTSDDPLVGAHQPTRRGSLGPWPTILLHQQPHSSEGAHSHPA
jgi:hypothetical protein